MGRTQAKEEKEKEIHSKDKERLQALGRVQQYHKESTTHVDRPSLVNRRRKSGGTDKYLRQQAMRREGHEWSCSGQN